MMPFAFNSTTQTRNYKLKLINDASIYNEMRQNSKIKFVEYNVDI